ncbi:hypothetical protein [Pseudomonas sp. SCB32]|nr:hypothetical protein [Pseudomonas sp. SCB32]
MAYAQGDITNQQELNLPQEAADTIHWRHAELRETHIKACIEGTAT